MRNLKQDFKNLCLGKILFKDLLEDIKDNQIKLNYKNLFRPSNVCRYCNKIIKENEFTITQSYWKALWFPCHKSCKDAGYKQEAYDCQCIDSDCNDCKYFKRDKGNKGQCLKYNIAVHTSPNFCSGFECFKHRKSDENTGRM